MKEPARGSTASQKLAAIAWVLVLAVVLFIGAVAVPVAGYLAINWLADGVGRAILTLVGLRGIALLVGVPMLLLGASGLLRMIRGKSAPDLTPRQLLVAAVSVILIAALGAGLVIAAITADGSTGPSGF